MPLNWQNLQKQIDEMAAEIRAAGADVKVEVIIPARESIKLSREEFDELEQRRADELAALLKRVGRKDDDEPAPEA